MLTIARKLVILAFIDWASFEEEFARIQISTV